MVEARMSLRFVAGDLEISRGRAPEGAAGVVLMDSLILTSGRLFVARVVQDLKLQTVSVWQRGGL